MARKPKPETQETPAKDVKKGQRLAAVPGETLRKRKGEWPTVTSATYRKDGEGGEPTVYIETHEKPGWTWCLNPGDSVSVVKRK